MTEMTITQALSVMEAKGKQLGLPMLETLQYCKEDSEAMRNQTEREAFRITMEGFRALLAPK